MFTINHIKPVKKQYGIKKLVTATGIIVLLPYIAFSQAYEYIPFPDSGAIWSGMCYPAFDCIYPSPVLERFALLDKDTTINDLT